MSIPMKTIPGYFNEKPGIQVGTKMEGDIRLGSDGRYVFDEQGVRFLKQMGVDWVMVGDVPEHNAKTYKAVREQLEERGLKIYRLQNIELHNMPAVTLGLPDRDRMIDRYLQNITDLGEAGIHYATYAHMGNGIWRGDARREVRGGATAGGLDLVPISDVCCPPTGALSNFRMSNLAYNSQPLDLLLADGRVVYTDVQFKETTYFKQIRPGTYQFYLAETNLLPMPSYLDIETMDSAFIGMAPPFSALASLQLEAAPRSTYTLYVLSGGSGSNEIQTLVVTDR